MSDLIDDPKTRMRVRVVAELDAAGRTETTEDAVRKIMAKHGSTVTSVRTINRGGRQLIEFRMERAPAIGEAPPIESGRSTQVPPRPFIGRSALAGAAIVRRLWRFFIPLALRGGRDRIPRARLVERTEPAMVGPCQRCKRAPCRCKAGGL